MMKSKSSSQMKFKMKNLTNVYRLSFVMMKHRSIHHNNRQSMFINVFRIRLNHRCHIFSRISFRLIIQWSVELENRLHFFCLFSFRIKWRRPSNEMQVNLFSFDVNWTLNNQWISIFIQRSFNMVFVINGKFSPTTSTFNINIVKSFINKKISYKKASECIYAFHERTTITGGTRMYIERKCSD